ncbi:MAG: L-glutamate gamma-semialdehyde dehydrogenase [Pseudomonadota bacterium]|nr:L-glutamate gamma-semialdehyde dehydrogenase [Pseudomonadota bacterium]
MTNGLFRVPRPVNEPVRAYAPGTAERASLERELARQAAEVVEIPCVVGGMDVYTGRTRDVTMPHAHGHVIARVHMAGPAEIDRAARAAEDARPAWAALPWEARAAVLLRAADLLAGPWRDRVNAATMLGQSKTVHQAEIDAACELIDFWRFNVSYYRDILAEQPPENAPGTWNRTDHRPLDGFVFAVTPFNFSSIAANLPTAPALVGNTVVWKPATTSAASCWVLYSLLRAAGLPDGVINLLHGDGPDVGGAMLVRPELGGVHFTGSTGVFQWMWRTIGENISRYRQYPRIVGETGGKDFILAHASADPQALAVAIVRGGFEYQGQKCSAASRIYVPDGLWPEVSERAAAMMAEMKQGDVRDLTNFVGAVIDEKAFNRHQSYLELARAQEIVSGGTADGSVGWFVKPTLVRVQDPHHRLMEEEIFGPIVTAYVYPEAQWAETLALVDTTSPYALTGAVFSRERAPIESALEALRHAAGNFYINDKPTGAVVGQQPFGGGRASGTNDKAGAPQNLLRWISPRTIKETFVPPLEWRYPFLG